MSLSDQQVVAAFNSCLDLDKWSKMPTEVKNRFKELMRYMRVKLVCFSDQFGMGLRVFVEPGVKLNDDDGDEAEMGTLEQVDIHGHWVRCPADLYTIPIKLLVMSEDGKRFVLDPEEPEDASYFWTASNMSASRNQAKVFGSREEAEKVAAKCNGVIVKK